MAISEAYRLTATEAVSRMRSGDMTVAVYAESLLQRIRERDDAVKAWAYLDPELVRAQASALDKVPMEERGPLHGLAVGVKDVIYTNDMPTQHNSPIYKDSLPNIDAASVTLLRHAGALIFGKTTTTEFAATIAGPLTRNPHDLKRTPGGSSSGSGAAVADFQAPLALGTQTGGSTVRPGSFNGIYALKPTWNAVSREGQKMYSITCDTLGLYARNADDLILLADVLGIHDDDDNNDNDDDGPAPTLFTGLRGARFGVCRTVVWPKAGPGTHSALTEAISLLRAHGAQVEDVQLPPAFDNLPAWHRTVMLSEGRAAFLPELRTSRAHLHQSLIATAENSHGITHKDYLAASDGIAALRPIIDAIAGRYSALITPSVPDEAPLGIENTGSAAFCSMWTALHTPVINIPGFQGENSLPIGLSFVAPRYRDRHLLDVAKAVGDVFEAEGTWKSQL